MNTSYILSVQVGKPKIFEGETATGSMVRPWSTGFFKEPAEGKIWLNRCNLSGDGQADLSHHGGHEKAILAYSADHYPIWCKEIDRSELPYGAFGENFTIAGLTEESVCIGDTYAVGDTSLQVSQPRQPCWKISKRWQINDLAERVKSTGRTGWYFRVITEGYVERGLPLVLLERPFPQWTVVRANEIMRRRREDRYAAVALASCPLLSKNWRTTLCASKWSVLSKIPRRLLFSVNWRSILPAKDARDG